jgi:capsular polysaccharide transport system permease protein
MTEVFKAGADKPPAMRATLSGAPADANVVDRPSPLVFQYRVLKALILRDMSQRHGDNRLGYLMGLLLPIVSLSAMIVMFGMRGKMVPADFSLGVFVVTGYPLWQGFQSMYTKAMNVAGKADPLLMFPQITQLDLILASLILDFATNTTVFILLSIGVMIVFSSGPPANPMGVLLCLWGCMWLGAALGLILCGLQRAAPILVTFLNTFLRFGMWISGVVFAINRLPSFLWPYLQWNPILHLVEGSRANWNRAFEAPIFDPMYVLQVGFVMTTLGLILERITRRLVGP